MIVTLSEPTYAVVDDLLPPEVFRGIQHATLHSIRLSTEGTVGTWSKEWRYAGQPPVSSAAFTYGEGPLEGGRYGGLIDSVGEAFLHLAGRAGFVRPGWSKLRMHVQASWAGTRLAWHRDKDNHGAFTLYTHDRWEPGWGGELLISDGDGKGEPLGSVGSGTWLAPLPNRCVILAPGVPHAVSRVDPDAGDAPRLCVVGFLLPPG